MTKPRNPRMPHSERIVFLIDSVDDAGKIRELRYSAIGSPEAVTALRAILANTLKAIDPKALARGAWEDLVIALYELLEDVIPESTTSEINQEFSELRDRLETLLGRKL